MARLGLAGPFNLAQNEGLPASNRGLALPRGLPSGGLHSTVSRRHSAGSRRDLRRGIFSALVCCSRARPRVRALQGPSKADLAIEALLARGAGVKGWGRRVKLEDLKVGQKLLGIVESIWLYGIYVDVGADTKGMVHISMIPGFVPNLHKDFQPGQKVTVYVFDIRDNGELALSMMPWDVTMDTLFDGGKEPLQALLELPEDEWVTGIVRTISKFGAFFQLKAPGGRGRNSYVNGLVPLSDRVLRQRIGRHELRLGDEVPVRVVCGNPEDGRLELAMERLSASAELLSVAKAFAQLSKRLWLKGSVSKNVRSGIYVDVRHPVQDVTAKVFVPSSELPEAEVEVGELAEVRLLDVNARTGKVTGSMLELLQ